MPPCEKAAAINPEGEGRSICGLSVKTNKQQPTASHGRLLLIDLKHFRQCLRFPLGLLKNRQRLRRLCFYPFTNYRLEVGNPQ